MQANVRSVQCDRVALAAIVEYHVKTAGHRDEHLLDILERMTSPCLPCWDIVEIENPRDVKWNVPITLDERQVPAMVGHNGKIDEFVARCHVRTVAGLSLTADFSGTSAVTTAPAR
jgi:hypothetical protein